MHAKWTAPFWILQPGLISVSSFGQVGFSGQWESLF